MDQQHFVCVQTQDFLTNKTRLTLPKGGRTQEIHIVDHDKKRPWMIITNVKITSPFTKNAFKSDPLAGHITVQLQETDFMAVQNVDAQIYDLVLNDDRYKHVDQVMLTPRTWEHMFRRSADTDGSMKLSLHKEGVALFDKDKKLVSEQEMQDNCWGSLEDARVNMVIEPTMVWFMNRRAGISWTVKQIRFLDEVRIQENGLICSYANWTLNDDDDDY